MTSEIDEGYDLARVIANLLGRLAVGVVDRAALRVEAENLVRYGGCAARLDFVQVAKHVETGSTSSIIKFTLRQNPKESRLAHIKATEDGDSEVDVLLIIRYLKTNRSQMMTHGLF